MFRVADEIDKEFGSPCTAFGSSLLSELREYHDPFGHMRDCLPDINACGCCVVSWLPSKVISSIVLSNLKPIRARVFLEQDVSWLLGSPYLHNEMALYFAK
jgi:hypothetical protein